MMMMLPPPDVDPLEGAARDTQGCDHGGESVICDDITPQRRELPLAGAVRACGGAAGNSPSGFFGRGHELRSAAALTV